LSGLVVDYSEDALVVAHGQTPYVFAWNELDAGSAYRVKRDLLSLHRGDAGNLTAADHLELGVFALSRGRAVVARNEFRTAVKLDKTYEARVQDALDAHRNRRALSTQYSPPLEQDSDQRPGESRTQTPLRTCLTDLVASRLGELPAGESARTPSPELRAAVRKTYDAFGQTVKEVMGKNAVLVETDHFLIWSDLDKHTRRRLGNWCENMYVALCDVFGFDSSQDIFLAKCPVFCWRSKGRFLKFARSFDGYDLKDAVGYTRSIEASGHVHIVLFMDGRREADLDRFSCTLVHEGAHAFVHRFHSSKLIPNWVNEGIADLTAERVLGDRCFTGEKTALLARQYARYNWSIGDLMATTSPIEIHQYPLAQNIVEYLESLDRQRFVGFLKGLKEGAKVDQALAANYDGASPAQLEAGWRSWILERFPADNR